MPAISLWHAKLFFFFLSSYTWTKDGQPLIQTLTGSGNASDSSPNGTLYLPVVGPSDEGYYQCEAYNDYGRTLSNPILLQRGYNKPFPIQESPLPYTAREGDTLMMPCSGWRSNPDPVFSWSLAESMADHTPTPLHLGANLHVDDEGEKLGNRNSTNMHSVISLI